MKNLQFSSCGCIYPEYIRDLMRYDADTGKLYWRKRPANWFVYQDTELKRLKAQKHWDKNRADKLIVGNGKGNVKMYGKDYSRKQLIHAYIHRCWPKFKWETPLEVNEV